MPILSGGGGALAQPTVLDATPPGAPAGLALTGGDEQVALAWTANTEPDIFSYKIWRGTSTGVHTLLTTITGSPPSPYTNTGLTNGTEYFYAVTAVDTSGNESAKSTEASATPSAPPDTTPPGVPSGMGAVAGDTEIVLDWDTNTESDVASYKLYIGTTSATYSSSVVIAGAANSTYTNTGLTNGTEYFYAVTCTDDAGNESAKSAEVSATPATAPVAGFTYSLYSDGGSEYVMIADVGNELDLQLGDTASWCFWMKPDGYVQYREVFTSRTNLYGTGYPGWQVGQDTNGRSQMAFADGNTPSTQLWSGLSNLETSGGWHHVCWTWDGTQPSDSDLCSAGHLKLYIDGVAEVPTNREDSGDIGVIDYAGITPRIFARDRDSQGLKGWLCDLRMYSVVLSEEEVEAIYNSGDGEPGTAGTGLEPVPGSITRYDDLLGWWKMEEGSGDTLLDASGNQKTGILYQVDWTPDTPDD